MGWVDFSMASSSAAMGGQTGEQKAGSFFGGSKIITGNAVGGLGVAPFAFFGLAIGVFLIWRKMRKKHRK